MTKVAVTDDHLLILTSLVHHINSFKDCNVTMQAKDGAELLLQLKCASELPDVCILDISMPILNGYDTLIEIKRMYPNVKVIGLSAFTTEYAILKMIQNGASAYLPKDCASEELQAAIQTLVSGRKYYSKIAPKSMFDKARVVELPTFSQREIDFLKLCCKQLKYVEIANQMCVSVRTVENYFNTLSRKTGLRDKAALIAWAKDSGLVFTRHFSKLSSDT